MDWFDGARFGMFVHWTHIAQRGWELSWPLVGGVGVLPLREWGLRRGLLRAPELLGMIRELQPGIITNDRLPGGDYATPEQGVPGAARGTVGDVPHDESSWGYVPDDNEYKSATELVHTLCEVAGKGANLLLNVSPRADGSLPSDGEVFVKVPGDLIDPVATVVELRLAS